MKIKQLSLRQAEYIAHRLALETMNFENEPMPAFNMRSPGKLESCLEEPFQTFDGKPLHRTFLKRAAVLFYLITKNHCFSNGNKRMAVTLTLVFFYINKKWLIVSQKGLYDIANDVAKSKAQDRDMIQAALVDFFEKNTRTV